MYKKISALMVLMGIIALTSGCGNTNATQQIASEQNASRTPQFIILSFDGSRSLQMWKDTIAFAREMKQEKKPVAFTYFISGVYLLNYRIKTLYHPPKNAPGVSTIGFADSNNDVIERVGLINQAIADGHEIGSHVNGHFDGTRWTLADWSQEFEEFKKLTFHLAENNNLDDKSVKINLSEKDMVGFRAPDLGVNENTYTALAQNGYRYDASKTAKIGTWPNKMPSGLWSFPLARLTIAHTNRLTLSMDFNFYVAQTNAKDILKKNTPIWNEDYRNTLDTYMNEFNANYNSNRAPIIIGHHFSTWNDGLYWEVMKSFVRQACGQPDVQCITMRDLANYLDTHPEIIPAN